MRPYFEFVITAGPGALIAFGKTFFPVEVATGFAHHMNAHPDRELLMAPCDPDCETGE